MIRSLLLVILFTLCSTKVCAEEMPTGLVLAEVSINRSDMESIKRGATFFANTCMACHTLIYLRYNEIAKKAGITYERMPINVKDWPLGVKPPDLSLEANVRGVNWIYTYLHSFYADPSRPTGFNNLVLPNTAMTNIIAPYQGEQALVKDPTADLFHEYQWYDLVKLTKQGTMTPEQFDATITDLVNFLAYAAEPFYEEQRTIGWWVLGFIVILGIMMYALKREYWRDVKRLKK